MQGSGRPWARWVRRAVLGVVAIALSYLAVTFVQVWWAARRDDARPAQAIVVLGAAQYNGTPSPDLKARLDHSFELWSRHLAPLIVVTGGKQAGDQFTEASASARYLSARGVPDAAILREVSGRSTWQSLASAAVFLRQRGITKVLLVSDPFHSERLVAISAELGMQGYTSPTRTSPIRGAATVPYFAKETAAVAAGRLLGFRRVAGIERRAPVKV